ncbi:MAG: DUF4176 domain-containing protein [Streptococcaceae bacterium]|nr:DUF4176 domain-containing protein [Streptococcaceae bacterium]
MNTKEFLPLGSIVVLEGSPKYFMITIRGVQIYNEVKELNEEYSYGAVQYPEGLQDGKLLYFNQKNIFEVIHKGFSDKQDEIYIAELNAALQKLEESRNVEIDPFADEK